MTQIHSLSGWPGPLGDVLVLHVLSQAARGDSTVAYHGSSPENFHSIVNTGLRVMSGSRLMKNGAAFGEGM